MGQFDDERRFFSAMADLFDIMDEGKGEDFMSYIFTHYPSRYEQLVYLVIEEYDFGVPGYE